MALLPASKLLSSDQAKAIIDAMAALNNCELRIHVRDIRCGAAPVMQLYEDTSGRILLTNLWGVRESYASQAEFITAYGF